MNRQKNTHQRNVHLKPRVKRTQAFNQTFDQFNQFQFQSISPKHTTFHLGLIYNTNNL